MTAVHDVPSSEQKYIIYPSQDAYPPRKPRDIPRMSPDDYIWCVWDRAGYVTSDLSP